MLLKDNKVNEIIKAIKERRSIRSFKSDPVPHDLVSQIAEAGLYAASSRGKQATVIVAVTEKNLRDRLSSVNCSIGGWKEDFDPFYGAPAVLIVLGLKENANHVYDGSLVMGNMMLAAHSLGLGSCWIHRAREEFEMPEFRALLKELGVSEEYVGIGHCAVGYIDGEQPPAPERKANRLFFVE